MIRRAIYLALLAALATVAYGSAVTVRPDAAQAANCSVGQDHLEPATGADSAQPVAGQVPVILVHGILSDPSIWNSPELGGGTSMARRLEQIPHTTVWAFDYGTESLDWVTDPEIGPMLARAITCITDDTGQPAILVDHSMGGLATQLAAAQPDGSSTVADHISEVLTLGTPFTGSKLLSVAQAAIRGTESAGGPDLVAAVEMLLSACAGISETGHVPGDENPCSVLAALRSPIGTALEYHSPQIAALPRWPASLRVNDIAGDIKLVIPIALWHTTVDVGDIAVPHDSATAHNTVGSPLTVNCTAQGVKQILSAMSLPCFHSNLPDNPQVVSYVVEQVRGLVAAEMSQASTSTSTDTLTSSRPSTTSGQTSSREAGVTTSTSPDSGSNTPSCSQWLSFRLSQREAAIVAMQAAHHDTLPETLDYYSVRAFCALYPNEPIDGVYNGSL